MKITLFSILILFVLCQTSHAENGSCNHENCSKSHELHIHKIVATNIHRTFVTIEVQNNLDKTNDGNYKLETIIAISCKEARNELFIHATYIDKKKGGGKVMRALSSTSFRIASGNQSLKLDFIKMLLQIKSKEAITCLFKPENANSHTQYFAHKKILRLLMACSTLADLYEPVATYRNGKATLSKIKIMQSLLTLGQGSLKQDINNVLTTDTKQYVGKKIK